MSKNASTTSTASKVDFSRLSGKFGENFLHRPHRQRQTQIFQGFQGNRRGRKVVKKRLSM
jgi:hypothetical protein